MTQTPLCNSQKQIQEIVCLHSSPYSIVLSNTSNVKEAEFENDDNKEKVEEKIAFAPAGVVAFLKLTEY